MEDVIKKIIRIEEKAQAIMTSTIQENEAKRKASEDYIITLQEKLIGDAHRKAKELRKRELSENATYVREIKKSCVDRIEAMELRAEAKQEAWVNYLVDRVLGD